MPLMQSNQEAYHGEIGRETTALPIPRQRRFAAYHGEIGRETTAARRTDYPRPVQAERHARSRQGPVLAVLTMLAAKMRLRVVPRVCALPLTAAPRGAP